MSTPLLKVIFFPIIVLLLGIGNSINSHNNNPQTYPEQLTGAFTGGFGERSCHHCHFDYPVNKNSGWIKVSGLPSAYTPDSTYDFSISTGRKGLQRAGFQLTIRFKSGKQAGKFKQTTGRTTFTSTESQEVQYLQHSKAGTIPNSNQTNRWKIKWIAPAVSADTIIVSIAANAANGDASEFSDFINTKELFLYPDN